MHIAGVICEYNPFHYGHYHQFELIREKYGADTVIVCLMSGSYVQRGYPAIFDKQIRSAAALSSGADLVLELPVTASLSSAEGFASVGVRILSDICDILSFGVETLSESQLFRFASSLNNQDFEPYLREALSRGLSFPAARQAAVEKYARDMPSLIYPNDTLAVEYCRAILRQESVLQIFPILRENNYHSAAGSFTYPSASMLRSRLCNNEDIRSYMPKSAGQLQASAVIHRMEYAENALLYRLRTMSDEEYEALPYGNEGLWRRFMHAGRECGSIGECIRAVKTKRYTHTRITRMLMCAFLGITGIDMEVPIAYTRILGFTEAGRTVLHNSNPTIPLVNSGKLVQGHWGEIDARCTELYGLFSEGSAVFIPEKRRRVLISSTNR